MNSPKAKAEELYMKFYGIPLYKMTVRECCLIAVNEILQADMFMMTEKQEKYWEQVKEEICKM